VAAYTDGRQGASSLRLNFSACDEERIAEGVRRIGAVVRERAALARALGRRRER
jgi:DNA-binding transcriptional MocR family regulator